MSIEFTHSQGDEAGIAIPAIGLNLFVRLASSATAGALSIIETINAPGFGPPLHRHPEAEIFRVLQGRYLYEVDDRRFYAEVGDVVSIPGGAAHTFLNVSCDPSRQLVLIVPGLDAATFFTGLGALMEHGVPARAALNAFGRTWSVEFLGPPLNSTSSTTQISAPRT